MEIKIFDASYCASCRYAIKIIDKTHKEFDLESLEKEIMILKKV
jgi:arsenate reductase-like glutaredoxin family protein